MAPNLTYKPNFFNRFKELSEYYRHPKNEEQFLCRNQTMNAIEKYFLERGKQALTKNKANILCDNESGCKAVKNDIHLRNQC